MSDSSHLLGAGGPLAAALEGFKARPAQQQMATAIDAALRSRQHLLVEAGTGTGKTYAYLVPALMSGLRVMISTGTRTLQDQLYHRDLPLLAAALGRPAQVKLLKGRANYLCRARFADMGRQAELVSVATDPLTARLRDWALATRSGDLSEVPELADTHPLRPQLSSTRENCSGLRCSEFSRCHVVEARRAAMEADIVVVNHHLLLADLALKVDGFGDLLPGVDAVILDEAHQLPDLASEFFGVSVGGRQIEVLLADLKRELSAAGLSLETAATLTAPSEQALAIVRTRLGRYERSYAWQELSEEVHEAFSSVRSALLDLATQLEASGSPSELQQCASRARGIVTALGQIIDEGDEPSLAGARTLTTHARGFSLQLFPYEIAERFRALVSHAGNAWIFTSATLAVGQNFSHFANRLGLPDAVTLKFDSPFDYATQGLLYLPTAMPDPGDVAYTGTVVAHALPLIECAGGGAFLLFTSHRALRAAAEQLRGRLPDSIPLLVQGSAPREQLLRQFRASGNAVLLGAASFWEGVDVQGSALRLVIIDRLPFASPEDPVVRARIEHLNAQGENAFRDYQLPEAALALKQGVGRLIRSESDHGVVVICDPRMTQRSYGRIFLSSLPPMTLTRSRELVLQRLSQLAQACTPALSARRA